ncbi:unnamed protein product [Cyclocybe aegerita]|uniref:Uncharacterized protein n=1 Tax=Cyclocybe aegerita TaxID=1973307 RepID=A0A8S0XTE7_CYCAE|nr:unnamed protein product [Cyclocybe aegerita]
MGPSFKCKHLDVHCSVRARAGTNNTTVRASSARRSHPHGRVTHASDALTLRIQVKPIKRKEDGDGGSSITDDSDNDTNTGHAESSGRKASTVVDLLTFVSVAAPEQTASLRICANAINTIASSTSTTPLPQPNSLPSPTNPVAGIAGAGHGSALADCRQVSPQSAQSQLGRLRLALPVGTIAAIIMIAMFCITLGMVIYVTQKGKSWRRFREQQLKHESQLLAFSFGGGVRGGRQGSGGFERGRCASRSRSGDEGRTMEYARPGTGGDEKPEDKALVERSISLKSLKSLFLPGLRLDRSLLDLQSIEESGPSTPLDARNFRLDPREDSPVRSPEEAACVDGGADANSVLPGTEDRPSSSSSATSTTVAPTAHPPNKDALHAPL